MLCEYPCLHDFAARPGFCCIGVLLGEAPGGQAADHGDVLMKGGDMHLRHMSTTYEIPGRRIRALMTQ